MVLNNFSLGTSGSPGGYKVSIIRDAINCPDFTTSALLRKSINFGAYLTPSTNISVPFGCYENLQELAVVKNTAAPRTRPRIPRDMTSNGLKPQLNVVGQPSDCHIECRSAEIPPFVPGKIVNDQSANHLRPSGTERLGRQPRRYSTRLLVRLTC
jgi:hypothetical protein